MEIVLETDRLILRHFLVDDLYDLYGSTPSPERCDTLAAARCPVIRT